MCFNKFIPYYRKFTAFLFFPLEIIKCASLYSSTVSVPTLSNTIAPNVVEDGDRICTVNMCGLIYMYVEMCIGYMTTLAKMMMTAMSLHRKRLNMLKL